MVAIRYASGVCNGTELALHRVNPVYVQGAYVSSSASHDIADLSAIGSNGVPGGVLLWESDRVCNS